MRVRAGVRRRGLWLGFLLLIASVMAAGYVGLHEYVHSMQGSGLDNGWLDLAYYDFQLFANSAPIARGPYPWPLQYARFAAPVVALVLVPLLLGELRRSSGHRRRGHVIVAGNTATARAIATHVAENGKPATVIRADDPTDPETWLAAGIAGARVAFACADDSHDRTANMAIASTLARIKVTRSTFRCYAHVSDASLVLALRARRLGLADPPDFRLDFFNVEEIAARELMRTEDLDVDPSLPPNVVIVGANTFGRSLLVELARQWRLRSSRRAERLAVTLVDPHAVVAAREVAERWDVVPEVCDVTAVEQSIETYATTIVEPPPHRVYLCNEDEDLALRTALTYPDLWPPGAGSVVVRMSRLAGYAAAFPVRGRELLDNPGGRLRLVGVTNLATHHAIIQDDLIERIAQAVHDRYLIEQLSDGIAMGAHPSMVVWHDLAPDKREANRAQSGDVGPKLALIGCTAVPRTGMRFDPRPGDVEVLAQREHVRWVSERRGAGWTPGARNDRAMRHPSLVPWEALPEADRAKARDAVTNLPKVLADVGLQIVRLDRHVLPDTAETEVTSPRLTGMSPSSV